MGQGIPALSGIDLKLIIPDVLDFQKHNVGIVILFKKAYVNNFIDLL